MKIPPQTIFHMPIVDFVRFLGGFFPVFSCVISIVSIPNYCLRGLRTYFSENLVRFF